MLLEVSVILHIKLVCFKQTNNSNNDDANVVINMTKIVSTRKKHDKNNNS